jgi:hypothetical protein
MKTLVARAKHLITSIRTRQLTSAGRPSSFKFIVNLIQRTRSLGILAAVYLPPSPLCQCCGPQKRMPTCFPSGRLLKTTRTLDFAMPGPRRLLDLPPPTRALPSPLSSIATTQVRAELVPVHDSLLYVDECSHDAPGSTLTLAVPPALAFPSRQHHALFSNHSG